MKTVAFLIAIFVAGFAFAKPSFADYGQYGQYGQYGGGSTTQSILIDKTVGIPMTTKGGVTDYTYVDNLSTTGSHYQPGQQAYFKIRVKNTSNTTLNNVVIKDYVPAYLDPTQGPNQSTFDSTNRIISYPVGNLNPDQEVTFYLTMNIVGQNNLPSDQGVICVTNKASAGADNNVYAEDSSQVCIEKQVLGVTQFPKAGPEFGLLLFGGQLITLGLGLHLRKRTS